MKRFDEVEIGDNLFIFIEETTVVLNDIVRSIDKVSYGDLNVIDIYPYIGNSYKYSVFGDNTMQYCNYFYKGTKYTGIIFTTKYEMERYIKELTMKYSEKVFNLNELLYNI